MTSRLSKQGEDMNATPASPALPGITHHHAEVNGTRLHYVAAGTSGSPVLLVHGVPQTWWATSYPRPGGPSPKPTNFSRPATAASRSTCEASVTPVKSRASTTARPQ